jgi:hypothetical protein
MSGTEIPNQLEQSARRSLNTDFPNNAGREGAVLRHRNQPILSAKILIRQTSNREPTGNINTLLYCKQPKRCRGVRIIASRHSEHPLLTPVPFLK